jgi:hypothetical protein
MATRAKRFARNERFVIVEKLPGHTVIAERTNPRA